MTNQTDSQPLDTAEENARMLAEALTPLGRDSFVFADLVDVARAETLKSEFAAWVVEEFYEAAEAGLEFEVVEGRRRGTTIAVERPTGGWTTWSMRPVSDPVSKAALIGSEPSLRMQEYTADDRGPGSYGPTVLFPLDVLFGERKRNEEYAEYLRLKAIFEVGESDTSDGQS